MRNTPEGKMVEQIQKSRKYRCVSPLLIHDLVAQEVRRGLKEKETLKAVKNRLHQIAGAYFESRPRYDQWLQELRSARNIDDDTFRSACVSIMRRHASSRERLPFLENFYETLLRPLLPIDSMLDLACGLNPLAIPWMPISKKTKYMAVDIFNDLTFFLNTFFGLEKISGEARTQHLLKEVPSESVDVILALKTLPCLDQIRPGSSEKFLQQLHAKHIIVSYPLQSLGGFQKGMKKNYEKQFLEMMDQLQWSFQRFEFPTELVFVLTKKSK